MPVIGRLTAAVERLYNRNYRRTGRWGLSEIASVRTRLAMTMNFPGLTISVAARVRT